MVVGETGPNVSMGELFGNYSEAEVLACCFDIHVLPCCINSPLRKDSKPSFGLYVTRNGHVRYIDYATAENGGLMELLCQYWHCTFPQALARIQEQLLSDAKVTLKAKRVKTFTRQERDRLTKLEVRVRPWQEYDYDYWRSYGVNPELLKQCEVYPISHKIITKKESPEDKGRRMVFKADKYAYVFVERKERRLSLKIYQPFNKDGFKWCNSMDSSVISLWTRIPEYGERMVICSSLKDALCVWSQLGIPAVAPQGEGYGISDTALKELKRRYRKVYISFDRDKYGKEDAVRLSEKTGLPYVIPDFGLEEVKVTPELLERLPNTGFFKDRDRLKVKDFSDYFLVLEDKQEFKRLKTLFK